MKAVLSMDGVRMLGDWINQCDNIVFFGGAGVSTESGIPDFRGMDGLYNQTWDYPPETILSHSFFVQSPEVFYRYYREKLVMDGARPNTAHFVLADLEREGKLRAVITQNIDGLHQAAGSKNVLELHGTTKRAYCMKCGAVYEPDYINKGDGVPICGICQGVVRPDVVLYEESLNKSVMHRSIEYISQAQMLIVGGTSLEVYPAAGMVNYYSGDKMVLINRDATQYDSAADLLIKRKIGQVLAEARI